MQEFRKWTAVRAGAGITIHGEMNGKPAKVSNVSKIEPGRSAEAIQPDTGILCQVAVCKDGSIYRLA